MKGQLTPVIAKRNLSKAKPKKGKKDGSLKKKEFMMQLKILANLNIN
jgi:hypothetical protein